MMLLAEAAGAFAVVVAMGLIVGLAIEFNLWASARLENRDDE